MALKVLDETIANYCFETIQRLEQVLASYCQVLLKQRDFIWGPAHFTRWQAADTEQ